MLALLAALPIVLSVPLYAKDRKPADNNNGWPTIPTGPSSGTSTGNPATSPVLPGGSPSMSVTSDDVIPSGTPVMQIICIGGDSANGYVVQNSGNDYRVARVVAGDIRYEIYKGSRFLASCSQIRVNSR